MMGMDLAAYTFSWFLYTALVQSLPLLASSAMLHAAVMPHVSFATILGVMLSFGLSFLAMAFVVAAVWNTAASAGIVFVFVYMALVAVGVVIDTQNAPLTHWELRALSLLSPAGFPLALHLCRT